MSQYSILTHLMQFSLPAGNVTRKCCVTQGDSSKAPRGTHRGWEVLELELEQVSRSAPPPRSQEAALHLRGPLPPVLIGMRRVQLLIVGAELPAEIPSEQLCLCVWNMHFSSGFGGNKKGCRQIWATFLKDLKNG